MNEINRRELLRLAGLSAIGVVINSVDRVAAAPTQTFSSPYGFVRETAPARRWPDPSDRPFASYEPGTLLRFASVENGWVRVVHDRFHHFPRAARARGNIYVDSRFIDELTFDEVTPINSHVDSEQKYIEINLSQPQKLTAWEGATNVHEAPVSAGLRRGWTPTGEFRIGRKRWARYMQGYDFDLPGVPFTQYFQLGRGIAIHGAYWHNDFGNPRSHGCVNLPNEDSRWLFRWAAPTTTDFNRAELIARGTKVVVHY